MIRVSVSPNLCRHSHFSAVITKRALMGWWFFSPPYIFFLNFTFFFLPILPKKCLQPLVCVQHTEFPSRNQPSTEVALLLQNGLVCLALAAWVCEGWHSELWHHSEPPGPQSTQGRSWSSSTAQKGMLGENKTHCHIQTVDSPQRWSLAIFQVPRETIPTKVRIRNPTCKQLSPVAISSLTLLPRMLWSEHLLSLTTICQKIC